ncbi:uncharacterized protein B0H64DRAFT_99784 [Chaetomium fimeti]|uniref:Uncharacterized protein n=1 Tax=Chaetomium fimeti TaxID=1854472 RepID=A0AAE0HNG0_9PEZI|nr:hypothetical protein B0H64DRAFT_99784 [Chaetomium fimeti]
MAGTILGNNTNTFIGPGGYFKFWPIVPHHRLDPSVLSFLTFSFKFASYLAIFRERTPTSSFFCLSPRATNISLNSSASRTSRTFLFLFDWLQFRQVRFSAPTRGEVGSWVVAHRLRVSESSTPPGYQTNSGGFIRNSTCSEIFRVCLVVSNEPSKTSKQWAAVLLHLAQSSGSTQNDAMSSRAWGFVITQNVRSIAILAAANSFGGRLSRLLGQKTNDIMQGHRWRSSMTEPSEAAKLDDLPHEVVQGGTSFDKPLPIALSLTSSRSKHQRSQTNDPQNRPSPSRCRLLVASCRSADHPAVWPLTYSCRGHSLHQRLPHGLPATFCTGR